MANKSDIEAKCQQIRKDYSPCDVSDALLKLHVPSAGLLKDIMPIPSRTGCMNRVVAPVSTVLFMDKDHQPGSDVPDDLLVPEESNLSKGEHFSDAAAPGSIVIMQQPSTQVAALLGDIVATRYKVRGIKGCVTDGRTRDIVGCGELCKDATFQCWAKSISSVGTSLEAKPWAVEIPLKIGKVLVKPGDILCADEGECVCSVIPRDKLDEVLKLLPVHKDADDGLLKDVQGGMGFKEAIKRHPNHYSNH